MRHFEDIDSVAVATPPGGAPVPRQAPRRLPFEMLDRLTMGNGHMSIVASTCQIVLAEASKHMRGVFSALMLLSVRFPDTLGRLRAFPSRPKEAEISADEELNLLADAVCQFRDSFDALVRLEEDYERPEASERTKRLSLLLFAALHGVRGTCQFLRDGNFVVGDFDKVDATEFAAIRQLVDGELFGPLSAQESLLSLLSDPDFVRKTNDQLLPARPMKMGVAEFAAIQRAAIEASSAARDAEGYDASLTIPLSDDLPEEDGKAADLPLVEHFLFPVLLTHNAQEFPDRRLTDFPYDLLLLLAELRSNCLRHGLDGSCEFRFSEDRWELFFRNKNAPSASHPYGNDGFGLKIVQDLVDDMGGTATNGPRGGDAWEFRARFAYRKMPKLKRKFDLGDVAARRSAEIGKILPPR